MHRSALFFSSLLWSSFMLAQSGHLDDSFGNNGRVITDFYDRTDVGNNLLVDKSGKIILAGSASKKALIDHYAIVRYRDDGKLDDSFGVDGRVATHSIDSDRVVFGGIMGLGQFSDGTIIAAGRGSLQGSNGFALVAYRQSGALETSFAYNGATIIIDSDREIHPLSLVVDGSDRIIVAASGLLHNGDEGSFVIYRFLKNGSIDDNFGQNGKVVTPIVRGINVPRAVKLDGDGNIVVGGFSGHDKFVVAKYFTTGVLDTSFGRSGIATIVFNSGGIDTLHALVIQSDNKIVVGGDVQIGSIGGIRTVDFGLARLTKQGQLDVTFNKTGKQITYFAQPAASSLWALALQADGKIVAAGDASIVKGLGVARYLEDGSLDESFGNLGKQIVPFDRTCHWEAVAVQPDDKIIAGGYVWNNKHYDMALVRFTADQQKPTSKSHRLPARAGN